MLEVEVVMGVVEMRLSAWPVHLRAFDGMMVRLCGFELEKLQSLSGRLCNPSFGTLHTL